LTVKIHAIRIFVDNENMLSRFNMKFPFLLAATFFISAVTFFQPTPAQANLKLCNKTVSRIGVALGYKDTKGCIRIPRAGPVRAGGTLRPTLAKSFWRAP